MTFLLHGKRSMKSHRSLPKLKLSGYTLRRSRMMSGPWKACRLIGSAWVSLAPSSHYSPRSPLLGPLSFPGGEASGISRSSSAGNAQWRGQAHHILTRKALTKQAFCFLLPSLHDNFLWMFRLQEFLIQETDVFQAERSLGMGPEVKIVWFQN